MPNNVCPILVLESRAGKAVVIGNLFTLEVLGVTKEKVRP